MKFVKTEELKSGMRLAKPIYNKNGVLLYDRNSPLTSSGITSVRNFGLIGLYILEPAEPAPPFSREDLEFEQLQTIYMFQLRDLLQNFTTHKDVSTLPSLLEDILRHYGSLTHRVNFNQNLRSPQDFMYKHSLSTAILTAMITSHMGYSHLRQIQIVAAALLYGIGYQYVPTQIIAKGDNLTRADRNTVQASLEKGLDDLTVHQTDFEFFPKTLTLITAYILSTNPQKALSPDQELQKMMDILEVANTFDRLTAMNLDHEPESELKAMQYLMENPQRYDSKVVEVLAECIHIAPTAASVDLVSGGKAIILAENPIDFMHPVILRLSDNGIYDLSDPKIANEIQIRDIMKTMDNRVHVDEETLKQFVPDNRLQEITSDFKRKLELGKQQKAQLEEARQSLYNFSQLV